MLITLWAAIVLCINYIDIFNKNFNSNKGFRFNIERVLLLLGGYVTLYFIYIVLWSQYSSVFDDIFYKHLSDKGVLKTSVFYITSPTPPCTGPVPTGGEVQSEIPTTTSQDELPQQSTYSVPNYSLYPQSIPQIHQTSPFSIQNNDILKWWDNNDPNQPFPDNKILDSTMYSNPITKVHQPTSFVRHNINQVPDWWESRQHSPNEPYPEFPTIDPSMYSNESC